MGAMLVVLVPPFNGGLTNLLQASTQVEIEQLVSQAAVKAPDEGIPVWLTRLDVVNEDPIAWHHSSRNNEGGIKASSLGQYSLYAALKSRP